MNKKIIAVDFDGTLCESNYPYCGKPVMPGIKAITEEKKRGSIIILYTMREGKELDLALKWCKCYGIEFDAVNENVPWLGFHSRKVCADVYIDDLAVGKDDWMMKLNSIYEDTKLRERFRGGPCEL